MRFALGDIAVGSFPETRISLPRPGASSTCMRSEEHTSELQSRLHLVCRLLLEKKKKEIHTRPLNSVTKHALPKITPLSALLSTCLSTNHCVFVSLYHSHTLSRMHTFASVLYIQ